MTVMLVMTGLSWLLCHVTSFNVMMFTGWRLQSGHLQCSLELHAGRHHLLRRLPARLPSHHPQQQADQAGGQGPGRVPDQQHGAQLGDETPPPADPQSGEVSSYYLIERKETDWKLISNITEAVEYNFLVKSKCKEIFLWNREKGPILFWMAQ